MNIWLVNVFAIGMVFTAIFPLCANADNAISSEYGAIEFEKSCSACHGFDGKGKGYMSDSLKSLPVDLTKLSKGNSGHFPFIKVYQAIEGSARVGIHKPREMPAWGDEFRQEADKYGVDERLYTRGVILELISHIYSIQEK